MQYFIHSLEFYFQTISKQNLECYRVFFEFRTERIDGFSQNDNISYHSILDILLTRSSDPNFFPRNL